MGAFWRPRIEVITTLGEIVGYKSGLALTRKQIEGHLSEHTDIWQGDDDDVLRIRSEKFEIMVGDLLYRIGNVTSPGITVPGAVLHHKYKRDRKKHALLISILGLFHEVFSAQSTEAENRKGPIDVTPFILEALERHGPKGARMAQEYIEQLQISIHKNPWSSWRREEWADTAQLLELFHSEKLQTFYGNFFDQRFIDYLHRNFDSIDRIHWRKFEGLTCEYFAREGFYVEIGEGRGDEGIDARVWPKKEDKNLPPTILIQCKRQKEKVAKLVVKALWADIFAEHADSGLIVTTSGLSPGAEKVCTARAYRIERADRETIRQWIRAMRSPEAGVFMGR